MLMDQFKGIQELLDDYGEDYRDPKTDWKYSVNIMIVCKNTAQRLEEGLARVLKTAKRKSTNKIEETTLENMR